MAKTLQPKAILSTAEIDGKLVLHKRTAPFRLQFNLVVVLMILMAIMVGAYISRLGGRPGTWIGMSISIALLLLLMERAWFLYSRMNDGGEFRFDKVRGVIERNGEIVANLSSVDHVLIRRVIDDPLNPVERECALVVALDDTRRFTIAESAGAPQGSREIEEAAQEIANYAGVKIEEGTRTSDEWWKDRG